MMPATTPCGSRKRQRGIAVEEGDGVAVDLVGSAAVELEVAHRRGHVRFALPERLAGVARFECGQCRRLARQQPESAVSKRPRSSAGMRLHGLLSKARRAARTARSTSALAEAGMEANTLPSDGQTTSMRSPDKESTERPSMTCIAAVPSAVARWAECLPILLSLGVRRGSAYAARAKQRQIVRFRQTRAMLGCQDFQLDPTACDTMALAHLNRLEYKPAAQSCPSRWTDHDSQIIPVEPFDFIIFGGTGDLAERKLLPALYHRQKRPGSFPSRRASSAPRAPG